MADRNSGSLEARLLDLGSAVAFPPTPPLVALVGERLGQTPSPRLRVLRTVGRGLAIALVAAVLLAGIAVAVSIGLGGLRLTFGPASVSPLPSLVAGPGLGQEISLPEARHQVTYALRVPALAKLGGPDVVYLAEPPAGGAVTLLYGARPGFPADPATGVALIVTQFRADIGPDYFEKLIDTGVSVTPTSVSQGAAWWIAGGEHFFFYRDANGDQVDSTLRLAGPTLIWEASGVSYRVEGAPSLLDATRVAESLE